jgi:predicted RNA-binding protein with PUA-like domain
MPQSHWLMKSEPNTYSYDQLVRDGSTRWDGVRNHEARNNLAAMKKGDLALFYHSNVGKEVVGVARVVRTAYQDPTTKDERWVVVDIEPVVALARPVTLAEIKADAALAEIQLVRRGRLSVVPVTSAEFQRVMKLAKTTVPRAKKST